MDIHFNNYLLILGYYLILYAKINFSYFLYITNIKEKKYICVIKFRIKC